MSKVKFQLAKIKTPRSVREAGKVLQAIDTEIRQSLADMVAIDLFSRGQEQGYCLLLTDPFAYPPHLRVAFAQEYNSHRIVVYWSTGYGKMGDFMRAVTEFQKGEKSGVRTKYFEGGKYIEAAHFICEILDGTLEEVAT